MRKTLLILLSSILYTNTIFALDIANDQIYIAKYKGDKTCAISYTFDDGLKEHFTLVAPQLEEMGFKGTFWINAISVNDNKDNPKDSSRVNWDELKKMSENGHEISNHGWSHKKLTRIGLDEVLVEIQKNDTIIYNNIGKFPRTFCYPYNAKNEDIIKIASKDRVGTRTKQFGIGGDKSKSTIEILDKKIEELIKTQEWGVAMIHGVTYGYDHFSDETILWNHWKRVKELEEKIWVATFFDVSSYIELSKNTTLKTQKTKAGYQITPTCSLDKTLFKNSLTAVIPINKIASIKQGNKKLKPKFLKDKILFDFDPWGETIVIKYK